MNSIYITTLNLQFVESGINEIMANINEIYQKGLDGSFTETRKLDKYIDLVRYFDDYNVEGVVDWTPFQHRTEWITIIEACYRLYGRVDYNMTRAKALIEAYGDDFKILRIHLRGLFKKGNRYTNNVVKTMLQDAYDKHGLKRNAKVSDIHELFNSNEFKNVKVRGERMIEIL